MSEGSAKKRSHESEESADSSDEWVGPKQSEVDPNNDEESENSNSQPAVVKSPKKRKSKKKHAYIPILQQFYQKIIV